MGFFEKFTEGTPEPSREEQIKAKEEKLKSIIFNANEVGSWTPHDRHLRDTLEKEIAQLKEEGLEENKAA